MDYLSNESSSTLVLPPTDKEEIANTISSLNSNKTYDLKSILFLLKNEISTQLADLFNLSFMTGVFPSVIKTAKAVPVFKKDSKLDYSNYSSISLLSNIKKILEKTVCKRDCKLSLITNKLSMTYSLDSDYNIVNLMF